MFDIPRRLLKVFMDELMAPATVETEDIDVAVKQFKLSIVQSVHQRFGDDIEDAARHLGRSTRWIYRVKERESGAGEAGQKPAQRSEAGGVAGVRRTVSGHELMELVLEFYGSHHPDSLTASACARALRSRGVETNALELTSMLDGYCRMGHLTRTSVMNGEVEDVRYRASTRSFTVRRTPDVEQRLERVGKRLRSLFHTARAYVEGTPDTYFSELEGAVLADEYARMAAEIQAFIGEAAADATARTKARDPDGKLPLQFFRGLYVMGLGPGTDPTEAGAEP